MADEVTRLSPAAVGWDRPPRSWSLLVTVLLVGVIVGAAIGYVAGSGGARYQATGQILISPDAAVDPDLYDNSLSLDTATFIQGELLRLNGDQVRDDVQGRLHLSSKPSFSFTQVQLTPVVEVTATADSRSAAAQVASTAIAVYTDLRAQALTTTIVAAQKRNDARLASLRGVLQVLPVTGSAAAATLSSLQTEYARLLQLATTLIQDSARVTSVVSTVTPVVVNSAPSAAAASTLFGAVGGGLLALLALLAWRRARPTLGTVRSVAELGLPVLLPVFPDAARPGGAGRAAVTARALAQQLVRQADGRPIVVTSASAGVGASFVAAQLADAIADQPGADEAPVQLVQSDEYDVVDELAAARTAGHQVVVDAAPLDVSDDALRCLDDHGDDTPVGVAVLVVGRAVSRPLDVLGAAQLLQVDADRVVCAVLNDVPRPPWWRRSAATG